MSRAGLTGAHRRHDNQFSAALAYDEAARSLKGESAVPNFQVLVLECAQTREALRAHFAMHKRILPEFHHLLHPVRFALHSGGRGQRTDARRVHCRRRWCAKKWSDAMYFVNP